MSILAQIDLFAYSEIEVLGDLQRLKLCLEGLPCQTLLDILNKERKNGRNDYPNETILKLVLAMKIFGHRTVESFRRELSRNSQLRKVCGLNDFDHEYGKLKLIPEPRVFSGFFRRLKKHQNILDNIFNDLVNYMYENIPNFGETLAGDGKYINSYAPNKNREITKEDESDDRCETDAEYSKKEYHYKDKDGNLKVKKLTYFGFRVHAVVDVVTELPVAFEVTKANEHEGKVMKRIIPTLKNPIYLLLDRGYDDTDLLKKAREKNIKPIVDIREMKKDKDSMQYKDTNIYYHQNGKVEYYDETEKKFFEMKYEGYDKERHSLRYSYKDKVYRIAIDTEPRIFNEVARNSIKFKTLYKGRTSVERYNGRLDRDYMFEDHTIRGLGKMNMMVTISNIIMLCMAKAHIIKKQKNFASLLKF